MKHTTLHPLHVRAGARMVDFAGWSMPVQYSGIIAEHNAVRQRAGIFDVGHMGEFRVEGPGAAAFLQYVTTNDVSRLADGQAQYSALAYPEGTVVDDLLVYRIDERSYMLVVNAANTASDLDWLRSHNRHGVAITDVSDETGLIAVQGPRARDALARVSDAASGELDALGRYRFVRARVAGVDGILSRTGYTGEDGFEFYLPADDAPRVWDAMLDTGRDLGARPAGLGARNTLRLEARLLLYGNDIDQTTTLLEAGLGWIVAFDKGDFIGRARLEEERRAGVNRRLVGFRMLGSDIARNGCPVFVDGRESGRATSAGPSITLKRNIGLAYLPVEHSAQGARFEVQIRKRRSPAEIVATPFYRRRGSI
jgi:aminomethyltransferase